jgi:hypothetical protein
LSSNLQSKLGEGLSKFQGGIEQGKLKLQTVQEINKLKKDIHDTSVKKSKTLLELGQKVYKKIRIGEIQDQELLDLTSTLVDMDHVIYKTSRKVNELSSQPGQENAIICPACETPNDLDSKFCGGCGVKVEQGVEIEPESTNGCLHCGEQISPVANYCHCCGKKVSI